MEDQPNTENVVYLDEYRKARWFRQLNEARELGGIATFNFEYDEPGDIIPFPDQIEPPDDVA